MNLSNLVTSLKQQAAINGMVVWIGCVSKYFKPLAVMVGQHAPNLVGNGVVFEVAGKIADTKPGFGFAAVHEVWSVRSLNHFMFDLAAPTTGHSQIVLCGSYSP